MHLNKRPIIKFRRQLIVACCAILGFHFHAAAQENAVGNKSAIVENATKNWKTLRGYTTEATTNRPVAGVRIKYKQLTAAISDSAGAFSIEVPDYSVSITVEGNGLQSKVIALRGRSEIQIALHEDGFNSYFEELVLPDRVTSISNIPTSATGLPTRGAWNRLAETPDAYLQGKVAGLQAIRRSGTPGIGANLFLRGFSSLYATNQPLVVIDGVVFDMGIYGSSLFRDHYNNPLSFIDIRDIDNITVLKEGVSQYGARAANGVILITTARAQEEATKIDAALYGGVNFAPALYPVMGAGDYRTYLSEILQSQGMGPNEIHALPYMNDNPSNEGYYKYHSMQNWQKKVFTSTPFQNGYLKIRGGDNIARYALSIGFLKNQGVIDNTDLSRYNVRFNADFTLSPRLTASSNLSLTYNEQKLKETGLTKNSNAIYSALVKAPFMHTNEVDANGTPSPTLAAADIFAVSNPLALTNSMIASNNAYRFLGGITFGYKLTRDITLASTFAITMDKVRETFFVPELGVVPDTLENAVARNRSGAQVLRLFNVYNDTRATYRKLIGNVHDFSVTLGTRFNNSNTEQDWVRGFNSATDKLTGVGLGANSLRRIGGSIGESRWFNTYLTTDYNYRGKYYAAFNLAIDASSRFGKDAEDGAIIRMGERNYPVFPSLDLAWAVSSEEFMKDVKWIDLFRVRTSAGITGNDDIGNHTAKKTYTSQNLLGVQGLVRGTAGNPALQWEANTRINAGVDFSVLNERLSFSFDVWKHKTDNMIVYEAAPAASGFEFVVNNSGAMKSTGWDASVQGRIVNGAKLKWDLGFNIAQYKSRVTALPADILTEFAGGTYLTRVGQAPNLFYGHVTEGVFSSNAQASSAGLSSLNAQGALVPFQGGDIRFKNINASDAVIDDNDRTVIGDPNPDFYGAINSNLTWKNWSVEALVTFVQGNDVYNYTRRQLESMSGYENQTEAAMNRWKNDGQNASMPRAVWGDPAGNSRFSDRWIEDGSYMRLRSVSVSYDFNIKPRLVKYAVVYLTGNNLVTLTKYKGYDPEFNVSSSVFGQGVDAMMEPLHKSVQVGIKLGL